MGNTFKLQDHKALGDHKGNVAAWKQRFWRTL